MTGDDDLSYYQTWAMIMAIMVLILSLSFGLVYAVLNTNFQSQRSNEDWREQAIRRGFGRYEIRHSGKLTISEFKWNGD